MKIIKKFLFIAGFFFFLIPVNTFANDGEEIADQIHMVAETGDISIEKVVTVYDFEGNEMGACMQCVRQDVDYGYVVCNENKEVVAYSIGAEYEFIYDIISENIVDGYYISAQDCLFTDNYMHYYILVNDGTDEYMMSADGDVIRSNGINITGSNILNNWNEIVVAINGYSGNSNYTLLESYNTYGGVCFSQSFITQNFGRYACAVVAMLEVCAQKGYFQYRNSNGSYNMTVIRQAYDYLWQISDTEVYDTNGGIQFGSTLPDNIGDTLTDFAAYKANRVITVGDISNPAWERIIDIVRQGKTSIFSMWVRMTTDSGVETQGHSVNLIGYARYRNNTTGVTLDFLRIADGWTSEPIYLKYDVNNFSRTHITYIE